MSENITPPKDDYQFPKKTGKSGYTLAQVDALNAQARAEKAAVRQAQKDLIKEAIIEALTGPEKTELSVTFAPVPLTGPCLVDTYRLTTSSEKNPVVLRADGAALRAVLSTPKQGYFARLWAALRGK